MVRAILDGTKTQTRRVVKPKRMPESHWMVETRGARHELTHWDNDTAETSHIACPYGRPGDRLWVREAWFPHPQDVSTVFYRATVEAESGFPVWSGPWRPSIHMPRWASRITLEITGVRVERLQDISNAEAKAEGCHHDDPCDHTRRTCAEIGCPGPDYRIGYRNLWEQINGAGSWAANPWVWVVEFTRTK